jgi:glycosyltransferase involved in cell wall biosynthesis
MIQLSILVPTIPKRKEMFDRLWTELCRQQDLLHKGHPSLGDVQLLVDKGEAFLDGGLSIGKKREALVSGATGKYVCFVDDDEEVSPNYLETLLRLTHRNADVITFCSFTKLDTFWMLVDMSLHYQNDQASPMFVVRRKPFHICPVKAEFAKQVKFQDISYGEDFDWMSKVLEMCTTEAKTMAIIHGYNHSSKISEADRIVNAQK